LKTLLERISGFANLLAAPNVEHELHACPLMAQSGQAACADGHPLSAGQADIGKPLLTELDL
jgi:hypothetical protein